MTTKEYRISQFNLVSTSHSEFNPKLKITTQNGKTHWLDISETELIQIRKLLINKN